MWSCWCWQRRIPLREKCPYSKFFWSVFSRIRTEYGEIRSISTYFVRMRENTDQNNFEYGHFLRSDFFWISIKSILDPNYFLYEIFKKTITILVFATQVVSSKSLRPTWSHSGGFIIQLMQRNASLQFYQVWLLQC